MQRLCWLMKNLERSASSALYTYHSPCVTLTRNNETTAVQAVFSKNRAALTSKNKSRPIFASATCNLTAVNFKFIQLMESFR